jgi:hypothetical protein
MKYYIIREVGTDHVYWKKRNKFEKFIPQDLQYYLMTKENAMVDLCYLINYMDKSCYIEEGRDDDK